MVTAAQRTAARRRRAERLDARVEWFGDQIEQGVLRGMETRVRFAAQYLKDRIVFNLSVPVGKAVFTSASGRSVTRVTERSQVGEFPRADTTRLMKDIFFHSVRPLVYRIGTTLDYGVILETSGRSFILRTFEEERDAIREILTTGNGIQGARVQFNDSPPGQI